MTGMTEPDQNAQNARRVSRESRLLLLTIVVCALVLLLLARLRFPDQQMVETGAQPLDRLAARASYDALAADIERVEGMIAPNLVALRVAPRHLSIPRALGDVLTRPAPPADVHHVAALRLDGTTAVAAIDPGTRIDGIVGGPAGGTATVLAIDPVRRLSRLRVPAAPVRAVMPLELAALRTPVYVVAVEGTQAGVTLRPVFLGRGERFGAARWTRPLLPLGGIGVAPGALLFSLAGEFLGCVVPEDGGPAIAGSLDVFETVDKLASGAPLVPATAGVSVQPLTPELAAATGAERGVVVAEVEDGGPGIGILRPGDVITAVDGQGMDNPERFLLRMASQPVGALVAFDIVRQGDARRVTVALAAQHGPQDAAGPVDFERIRGVGTRVIAGSPARGLPLKGLERGDIITGAGDLVDPTPVQLRRLLSEAAAGSFVVLTVRRDGQQRVIAIRSTRPPDAAGN